MTRILVRRAKEAIHSALFQGVGGSRQWYDDSRVACYETPPFKLNLAMTWVTMTTKCHAGLNKIP
jgi:hypothetical protein